MIALLLLFTSLFQTQDTLYVRVGNPQLDYSRIIEETEQLELFIAKGDVQTPISSLKRTVAKITKDGKPAWMLIQQYSSARGINVDTTVMWAEDLMPLRYSASVGGEIQRFHFTANEITGEIVPAKGERQTISEKLSDPVFNAVADHKLIETMPLREGFLAVYDVYNPGRGFGKVRIRVKGSQSVTTTEGTEDTWVLSYDAGAAPTTLWISKKSHKILSTRAELGANGVFWRIPAKEKSIWLEKNAEG